MKPAYYGNARERGIFPRSSLVPFYKVAWSVDSRDYKGSPLKTDFRNAVFRLWKVSLYIFYFRTKFQIPASNPSSFSLIIPNAKENAQTTIFYFLQIMTLTKLHFCSWCIVKHNITLTWRWCCSYYSRVRHVFITDFGKMKATTSVWHPVVKFSQQMGTKHVFLQFTNSRQQIFPAGADSR